MAKNYCVCILLDKTLSKTLLIKKAEGKLFGGMYNGLGGKIEKNETAKEACIREVYEESNEIIKLKDPKYLLTLHFPPLEINEEIDLHCFYDVIDEITIKENREGKAYWKETSFLLDFENENIVGYGNLAYFCRLAIKYAKVETASK